MNNKSKIFNKATKVKLRIENGKFQLYKRIEDPLAPEAYYSWIDFPFKAVSNEMVKISIIEGIIEIEMSNLQDYEIIDKVAKKSKNKFDKSLDKTIKKTKDFKESYGKRKIALPFDIKNTPLIKIFGNTEVVRGSIIPTKSQIKALCCFTKEQINEMRIQIGDMLKLMVVRLEHNTNPEFIGYRGVYQLKTCQGSLGFTLSNDWNRKLNRGWEKIRLQLIVSRFRKHPQFLNNNTFIKDDKTFSGSVFEVEFKNEESIAETINYFKDLRKRELENRKESE